MQLTLRDRVVAPTVRSTGETLRGAAMREASKAMTQPSPRSGLEQVARIDTLHSDSIIRFHSVRRSYPKRGMGTNIVAFVLAAIVIKISPETRGIQLS
jgi:hypothetical protein